jgi:adenine-specific DNA-methyltransferase
MTPTSQRRVPTSRATPQEKSLDAVLGGLGTPYFRSERIALYQGDCIDVLERLQKPIFDLVVTSPPYNLGKEYEKKVPLEQYLAWCESWLKLLHRVTADDGAFWLNLGYVEVPAVGKAVPLSYLMWQRCPFFLMQEVVWNYGAGVAARRSFSPRNEKFLWYVKDSDNYYFDLDAVRDPKVKYPNQKKNGKLKCNPLGKNPTDVWAIPKVTSGTGRSSQERTPHPAQFPQAVIERIVLSCSRPGDVVFDPFVGSGTVVDVAARLGRRAVGIDISGDYLDIAVGRVHDAEHADRQGRLRLLEEREQLEILDDRG